MMEGLGGLVTSNLLPIGVTIGTGVIAYIFGGKMKQKVELEKAVTDVEGSITDNVVKNLEVYQRMFEDLDEQLLKAEAKIIALDLKLEEAEVEKNLLKEKVIKLTELYTTLKIEYKNSNIK